MTLRLGLIGAGQVAHSHRSAFDDLPGCQISSVFDPQTDRADHLVAAAPGSRRCASVEDLLASDVDAVVVSAPTQLHRDLGLQALQAGKHVLMEKPFTRTAGEATELGGEADRQGLTLMPAQVVRFLPAMVETRRRHSQADAGPLVQAVERRFTRRTEVFDWWRDLPEFLLSHWGSHSLDAVLWLTGDRITDVDCWTSSRQSGYDGVDDFTLVAQTASGGTISLHQTYSSHIELFDWVFVWEQATAAIEELRRLSWNGDAVVDTELATALAEGFREQGREFADAILGRRPLQTTVESLLPCLEALDRARDAAQVVLTSSR